MTRTARRVAWVVLALAMVTALAVARAGENSHSGGAAARAAAISEGVRCPTCRGQSVADSAAPAAAAIRADIRRRVADGQNRAQIESYLVSRYGDDILLTPPGRGVGRLVWAVPVVAIVLGAGGLGLALRRWSKRPLAVPSAADRIIVDRASRSSTP